MKNKNPLLIFTVRGREEAYLAGLITLRTPVRIRPNATKNCKDSSSALKLDEGPNGHRCLTEFGQKTGSCDRNIFATADGKFSRGAQIISGLFSFNHFPK